MTSGFAPESPAEAQWQQAVRHNSRIASRAFAVLFTVGMVTQWILLHTLADRRPGGYFLYSLPLLLGLMALFEWRESVRTSRVVAASGRAPRGQVATWWIAATIEALAPISAVVLLGSVLGWRVALGSPPLVAASLIPMVSILRLDRRICVWQGAVAAAGFGLILLLVVPRAEGGLAELARDPAILHFGKAMLLFAGGALAGLVAHQGRQRLLEVIRAQTEGEATRQTLHARTPDYRRAEVMIGEKDDLISILSHDLRAPLDGVAGLAELMARAPQQFTAEEIGRYAGEIRRTAHELRELLDNLVAWAELRSSDHPRPPERLVLAQVVGGVARLFEPAISARGIALEINVPAALLVRGDEVGLATVVRNLLSNAVKFTPPGGRITIRARPGESPATVALSVIDSGIGLAAGGGGGDEPTAAATAGKGRRGLGLALSRQLMGLLDGTLELRPGATGGTEARMNLRSAAEAGDFAKENG
jgi:signal transduction histidine kinase